MNKTTTTLAAAALLSLAGSAMAQSSVTVFGVIDLAARSVDNGTAQRQLAGSGLNSSRLGFRGTEDLGGGLKANFWIEGAVNADDGNATGQTWQRRSTIGLQGGFGEVRFGRQKNPTGLTWEQLDVFGDTGMAASGRLHQLFSVPTGGAYSSFSRSSNSMSYDTPGSTGFFGTVFLAAGEGTAGNKYTGGRVGYRAGPLFATLSYGETRVNTSGGPDVELLTFGATYDLKVVKLFGMYSTAELGAADQKNLLIGASVPLGATTLRASFHKADGGGSISNREAKQFSLGAQYDLSRRTALYTTYSKIDNSNTALTVAPGSALRSGDGSSGYEFGIRHSF
jgi:predicted porin